MRKQKENVPLYMKIRIALSGVLTLIWMYLIFALEAKDTRDFLPDDQNPLWVVLTVAAMVGSGALLLWGKRGGTAADADPVTLNPLVVTSCAAQVRPGPGKGFKFVTVALQNDLLRGLEPAGWLPVLLDGEACWVREGDVQAAGAGAPPNTMRVNAGSASIRKGPDEDFDAVRVAHQGDTLLRAEADGWLPILQDGEVYWVDKNDVRRMDAD
ncbi:MAG TPA: hypothetical protein IAA52_04950 [Candidatus Pullichristensenella stercorigallinarum]|uniref:SH3 domain-containing protein n=1 Tax=Candidatus Pullichristensenella stercorigallinarum TaxID=2840909 RepID=A0A9D1CXE9_9FIRM|nr:hypothetical protein [Candidatus Pullichristensenella stercorigallinarum]